MFGLSFAQFIKNSSNPVDAFTSSNANYVTVSELWDSGTNSFNATNLNTLIDYISDDGYLSGINADKQTAADIRGYTYNGKTSGQAVVVTLGGILWQVVYLTRTNDTSGDRIATLLMVNNDGTATYGNSSSYRGTNSFTSGYPTSMYGTSHIRAVTLNNGGPYANIINGANPTSVTQATQDSSHKYALFTVDSLGLTDYLVQPKNVWYQTQAQLTGSANPAGNTLNNESLSTNINTGWYQNSTSYTYQTKTYYTQWGNDHLWLPSLSETGASNSELGFWELSTTERSASSYWWSRSGYYNNSSGAYLLYSSGSSSDFSYVDYNHGVRAALHLNLDSAAVSAALAYDISASVASNVADVIQLDKNSEIYYTDSPINIYPTFTISTTPGYYVSHITVNGTRVEPSDNASTFTQGTGYSIKCYRMSNKVYIMLDNVSRHIDIVVYGDAYDVSVVVSEPSITLMNEYMYTWYEDGYITTRIAAEFVTNDKVQLFIDGAMVQLIGDSNTGAVVVDDSTITYSHSIFQNYINITIKGLSTETSHKIVVGQYTGSGSSVTTSFSGGSGSVTVTSSDSDIQRLVIKPNNNSGGQTCYVGSIVIDGMEFSLDYYSAYLFGAGTASSIRYTTSDTSNAVVLEITGLGEPMHIEFNITTVRPEYDVPPTSGGGVGISGSTVVTAGLGGEARIVGMDNTAETGDTVSLMAVAYSGYRFVGWVDATDESTILSTSASETFDKADVSGMVLKALFTPTSTTSTDNTTDNGQNTDVL